jgi:hypothetical protein
MQIYERATELLEAQVGDELVALDLAGGMCFGFNSVATDVWQKLETPLSFDQIKAHLLAEYDVDENQCTMELKELLARMVDNGLVSCKEAR